MPVYRVQGPDGRIHRFEGPEGASPQEIESFAAQQFGQGEPDQSTPVQKAPEKQDTSLARTVFDQAGQGLTFNLMDEGQDLLGAAGAKIYDKLSGENVLPSFTETLKQARQGTQDRLDQQLRERPLTSIASNLAGSMITGGAIASTKSGKAVADSLRTGSRFVRAGKGALAGAISGGASGLGSGKDEFSDRMQSAGRGSLLGAVAGAATNAIPGNRTDVKKNIPTSDQLKKMAGKQYQRATQAGGELSEDFTDKFLAEIQKIKPQTKIGQIVGGDSEVTKFIDKLGDIKGMKIDLDSAQELDELIGDAIDARYSIGGLDKQGKKLLDVQSTLRDMIESVDDADVVGGKQGFEALKKGREMWADSRRLRDIERILQRAEMTDNPATSIKAGFRTLANNPKRLRGFTAEQQKSIAKAAKDGTVPEFIRTVAGSRLVSGLMGNAIGGTPGSVIGAGASAVARGGASRARVNEAQKIAEMIAGKYAPAATYQPPMAGLLSFVPPTATIAPSSQAEQISRILMQKK